MDEALVLFKDSASRSRIPALGPQSPTSSPILSLRSGKHARKLLGPPLSNRQQMLMRFRASHITPKVGHSKPCSCRRGSAGEIPQPLSQADPPVKGIRVTTPRVRTVISATYGSMTSPRKFVPLTRHTVLNIQLEADPPQQRQTDPAKKSQQRPRTASALVIISSGEVYHAKQGDRGNIRKGFAAESVSTASIVRKLIKLSGNPVSRRRPASRTESRRRGEPRFSYNFIVS